MKEHLLSILPFFQVFFSKKVHESKSTSNTMVVKENLSSNISSIHKRRSLTNLKWFFFQSCKRQLTFLQLTAVSSWKKETSWSQFFSNLQMLTTDVGNIEIVIVWVKGSLIILSVLVSV